jgi:hypothetical protein
VDHRNPAGARPFGAELARWRAVPGGVDSDGHPLRAPGELTRAQTLLGILRQFPGYTLRTLLAEDADLFHLIEIERLGTPEPPPALEGDDDDA